MRLGILLLSVVGQGAGSYRAELVGPPKPGDAYPALVLPSVADGSPLSITQFRGRKVLLLQFASW